MAATSGSGQSMRGRFAIVHLTPQTVQDTSSTVADEACMLLSNLSRLEKVCAACLKVEDTPIKSLRKLVDLFAKEGLNPNANYDYLAHVFANLSADDTVCTVFSL